MKTTSRVLLAVSIGTLSSMAQADSDSNSGIELLPVTVKTTSAQADSKGFIEDSSLSGTTRNFYAKEQEKRDSIGFNFKKDGGTERTGRRDTWTQGTILNYTSGFTQGAIGVGTEVAAYNEIALEQGHARIAGGGNRTLTDSDGDAIPQWSKLGLANVKFRASNTTITAGRQSIDTPVVAYIGNRALPSSFNGFSFTSAELTNLTFVGSSFDRESPRTGAGDEKLTTEYGNRALTSDRMSMLGVEYQPLKSLKTSLYASKVEDFWNQYYLGLNHDIGDAKDLEVATAFSYYKSKNTGDSKLGTIDNDTYSVSITGTHNAHSLTFAYQENNGNEYFDYVHETNAIYLANSLFSDYNGPNEKSFQIAYGLNMADYGVPGLKFTVYQARGWGIDGTHYHGTGYDESKLDGEHHYEYAIGAGYTLQSGPLKASTVRASYTAHRASANQVDGSLNELRVVTTVPFSIF